METLLNQPVTTSFTHIGTTFQPAVARPTLWTRFLNYCKAQEGNRLKWLGVILAVHGCILTPAVLMFTLLAGPSFVLFMTAMVAMAIALVTNLAAMPTKITIPAFALSVLIDALVIAACVVLLLV